MNSSLKKAPSIQERINALEEKLNTILLQEHALQDIEDLCRQIHILKWRRKYEEGPQNAPTL